MNYTFNPSTINNQSDYKNICPLQYDLYMQWFTSYIILFALMIFSVLAIYIIMDIRLQKEIKKNETLLQLK